LFAGGFNHSYRLLINATLSQGLKGGGDRKGRHEKCPILEALPTPPQWLVDVTFVLFQSQPHVPDQYALFCATTTDHCASTSLKMRLCESLAAQNLLSKMRAPGEMQINRVGGPTSVQQDSNRAIMSTLDLVAQQLRSADSGM